MSALLLSVRFNFPVIPRAMDHRYLYTVSQYSVSNKTYDQLYNSTFAAADVSLNVTGGNGIFLLKIDEFNYMNFPRTVFIDLVVIPPLSKYNGSHSTIEKSLLGKPSNRARRRSVNYNCIHVLCMWCI